MTDQRESVGIVGVGRMGLPMVKHLIAKGFAVTACDINPGNCDAARALGATIVARPADFGPSVSFVILGVGYDAEVMAVTTGEGGVFATMAPGTLIAVSATVFPATVKALAAAARERGCDVLDAPICRGRWFADEGKLLALFGGADEAVARGRIVYGAFCSDIAPLGDVGHGQVAKALNNLLLWIGSIGIIEAGRIAESTGIDLPKLRAALMLSSGKSQALEDWEQTSFTWALKDMQIVSAMTDEAGLSLPLTGAVKEMVKEARRIKATNPPGWTAPAAAGA
ncbi:3-hydroxyisobutyrate dehydrogenase-like beta-hydroxyacid dehydrogenase [Sphingomonas vulcanisoli]|uniref:3-hydroxyisobutyrate dehydrogenase-like beta-hydroxyacid dehydrogenase n=1 Tax=Sphingomonas vulcanisoli TaxID=1658060 RepID=A0ABX0TUV3_9SPHN|nr:NAD(P)-dependent oxidoreductase [Sphingomonas vulcanisoli]NIJ09231.1 3-hydroxyisobutyrate dehydrogenase-like beta-hydroxyacid dehydrogenase [Sphingomonas vulcanisoli]